MTQRETDPRAPSARRVLVLGAGSGATNNLVRSLRVGDPSLVIVGCNSDPFMLKKSPADRNYLVPALADSAFADRLRHVVEHARVDLIIPTTDAQVKLVSTLRGFLGCRVFLPVDEIVDRCQDKHELTRFLRERGIPAPLTYAVNALDDVDDLFQRFAPRSRLWCRIRRGAGSMGAVPVASAAQARGWISYWADMRGVAASAFTLSEYLPGRDFACQSLWRNGDLVLIKTTERLAYFGGGNNPSGVSSVGGVHKTVREPRVVEVSTAAVRALAPDVSGAFSVDLKHDVDGTPCVTEINVGRLLSGTTIFDLTGKHNMAATYVRLAFGEPIAIADPYDLEEDRYMVRDLDTLPEIFGAEEIFDGIEDARE